MQTVVSRPEGDLEGEAPRRGRGLSWFSPACLRLGCLLLLFALTLPGCSGCRQDPDEDEEAEKEEEEEEKPKENYESGRVVFWPAEEKQSGAVKPGHWSVFSQEMRANNFDFTGQLYVAPASASQQEMELEGTPYRLAFSRPVPLPQGRIRKSRLTFFMPRPRGQDARSSYLRVELRTQGGGRMVSQTTSASNVAMPVHQYFMVVLAGRPSDYGYLGAIFSRSPGGEMIGEDSSLYRVVRPQVVTEVPLPDHPLAWTSIAYLVMDDFDPTAIKPAQEAALIDWLHWGGQIVISGPRTLDRLKGTALAEYLPAEAGAAVELTPADFQEINAYWKLDPRDRVGQSQPRPQDVFGRPVRPSYGRGAEIEELTQDEEPDAAAEEIAEAEEGAAEEDDGVEYDEEGRVVDSRRDSTEMLTVPDGVELELAAGATWLPHSGELVAERQVGRGRIVVTSFSLSNRNISSYWISRESFINGALMGLPGREFSENGNLESRFRWVGENSSFASDPRVTTNMRFFSRDLGAPGDWVVMRSDNAPVQVPQQNRPTYGLGYQQPSEPETFHDFAKNERLVHGGWATTPYSGVAGWSDFSAAANAARETLNEAAGIEVPSGDFVAKVLLVYIFVLVPVNWLFFRLIGRVELAWVAAPIIAIVGMVAVVKVAQLDIGFARSRTEVAVLELQPGHDRGHLTRYVGLYTSLATGFSLGSEESLQPGDEPLLLPFSTDPVQGQLQPTRSTVRLDRDENIELNGMNVISASTGMVHIEQMLPLGGELKRLMGEDLEGDALVNGTSLALHDVGIVRRARNGRPEVAWVGELEAGASLQLDFQSIADTENLFPEWNLSPTTRPSQGDGKISLRRLIDLAADPARLENGEARLVGWYDAELGPIDVRPRTTQNVFRTMVVANLAYAQRGAPGRDANLPAQRDDSYWEGETFEVMPQQP